MRIPLRPRRRLAAFGFLLLAQAGCSAGAMPTDAPTSDPATGPTTGPTSPDALDGVWLGLRQNGITGQITKDYWTFFADGRVMRAAPDEGLDRPVDYARVCARDVCGTYTRAGAVLRVHWRGDAGETLYDVDAAGTFAERGTSQRYRPLAPLTGLRLAARYAVVDSANALTLVRVAFGADGRFSETRLMTHTFWTALAPPGETRVALPGGSGAYRITRNTLELRYDGGPTAYFFFDVPPGEASKAVPDVVEINEASIDRER